MRETKTAVTWTQVIGKPKTLADFGIIDPVVLITGTYQNPSWIYSLDWGKIINAPAFEPALGNPAVSGYVLSSTVAGTRSWIAPPTGGGTSGAGTIGEVPAGAINGSNLLFTLLQPFIPATLIVYLNGLRQRLGIDFTVAAANQFALTSAPIAGDSLLADYYQP